MGLKLGDFLKGNKLFNSLHLSAEERAELIRTMEEEYLFEFLSGVILESEQILAIDPKLEKRKILEIAAENIVKDLDAEAATIRLFDAKSLMMLSFGSYGIKDYERLASFSVRDSIAGLVVSENRSILVPNIMDDPLYKSKAIIGDKGYNSLMAVPLRMPSFVGPNQDLLGSIQIYYRENNRSFSKLEVIRAEMLARRVSYVLAKKKILDLHALNEYKEQIGNKIFIKLSNREGIKLKDFFKLMLPELSKFIQLKSYALFTISDDLRHIFLEAAYPLDQTYHKKGHNFTVDNHPYFWTAIHGTKQYIDMPYERIDSSYVLIKNPFQSELASEGIRRFARENQINSLLLVPLRIDNTTRHILMFYATEQKLYFSDEEVELLTFFGKEIMKASRLEFLGDMLHDFKNPAIAVAGLANRSRKLLQTPDLNEVRGKLATYLDVVARETARLQDLALTITGEGREEVVDLGEVARNRFVLNKEVIRATEDMHNTVQQLEISEKLPVLCPVFGLERVLDNLLNNATKATPKEGGFLTMRCYREGGMACMELRNTGRIPLEQIEQVRQGEVKGRGLNIVHRFIQANHGEMQVRVEGDSTIFSIKLPLVGGGGGLV